MESRSPRRSVHSGTACGAINDGWVAHPGCFCQEWELTHATFPLLHVLAFYALARRPCCARENAIEGPAFELGSTPPTALRFLALPRWRARDVQWALGFLMSQGKSSPIG